MRIVSPVRRQVANSRLARPYAVFPSIPLLLAVCALALAGCERVEVSCGDKHLVVEGSKASEKALSWFEAVCP